MTRLVTLLLLFLLTGCASVMTAPTVQLTQLKPVAIDSTGLVIAVELLITNPNRFDLTLLHYVYTMEVAGVPLGTGQDQRPTIFSAGQDTVVVIPARIRHRDLLNLLQQQPDLDLISYRLTANLQVDSPLGERMIAVDHPGRFSIPERYRPNGILNVLKELLPHP